MDYLKDLHEMCEVLSRELGEANEKVRKNGGKLSGSDLEYIDRLTHAIKSIKTTITMMEAEEDGGYSGRMMPYYGRMSYADGDNENGMSMTGRSYARGRGARRDSMGRYSRGGYSYADNMDALLDEMRGMMGDLPEEKRREVQRFVDKMDRM